MAVQLFFQAIPHFIRRIPHIGRDTLRILRTTMAFPATETSQERQEMFYRHVIKRNPP